MLYLKASFSCALPCSLACSLTRTLTHSLTHSGARLPAHQLTARTECFAAFLRARQLGCSELASNRVRLCGALGTSQAQAKSARNVLAKNIYQRIQNMKQKEGKERKKNAQKSNQSIDRKRSVLFSNCAGSNSKERERG